MEIIRGVTGLQHIGIPTENMEKTVEFYSSLGFKTASRSPKGEFDICFMELGGLVLEFYQCEKAVRIPGAVDHIALNVTDIEKAYSDAKAAGLNIIENEIMGIPFVWENGVRFFTVLGPNDEKIEFNNKL